LQRATKVDNCCCPSTPRCGATLGMTGGAKGVRGAAFDGDYGVSVSVATAAAATALSLKGSGVRSWRSQAATASV